MPQDLDAEIRALQLVMEALEPLDDEARNRVLEYTLKRLGVRDLSMVSAAVPSFRPEPMELTPSPSSFSVTDIRTLRAAKQPSSAVEMTALVAYYLAEAAPPEERKRSITTTDVEKYFKQANYRLPTRIEKTLQNASAAGYFDRVERGEYRLNPVGFNLVTQSLPRGTGSTTARAPTRKRSGTNKASPPTKK